MKLSEYITTTPTDFARQNGFPIPVITRFLRGERGLSGKTMKKIVDVTEGRVTFDDLLAEFPEKLV